MLAPRTIPLLEVLASLMAMGWFEYKVLELEACSNEALAVLVFFKGEGDTMRRKRSRRTDLLNIEQICSCPSLSCQFHDLVFS